MAQLKTVLRSGQSLSQSVFEAAASAVLMLPLSGEHAHPCFSVLSGDFLLVALAARKNIQQHLSS